MEMQRNLAESNQKVDKIYTEKMQLLDALRDKEDELRILKGDLAGVHRFQNVQNEMDL